MRNIYPEYSKSAVNRAGDTLLLKPISTSDLKDWIKAFQVMENWRVSHNYPINTFQANLRKKIKVRGFKNAIVAQRLKRVPSIISKLQRNNSMRLSRMQDIGGLRSVVNTVKQIYLLREDFIGSRFSHELAREYDYIKRPKDSGYRGIHLVYKYKNSRAPKYDSLLLEVQIRNKLQHSWATAVETMGTFLNTSLKSSEGPGKWLHFFALAGSAFANHENSAPHDDFAQYSEKELAEQLSDLDQELHVTENLHAFSSTIKTIDSKGYRFKYYLLHLIPLKNSVRIMGFYADQLEKASKMYTDFEKRLGDQKEEQIVLVSASSFKQLKYAYPNYFLDTTSFISNLKKIEKKFR